MQLPATNFHKQNLKNTLLFKIHVNRTGYHAVGPCVSPVARIVWYASADVVPHAPEGMHAHPIPK
jgi:hypothetical protein